MCPRSLLVLVAVVLTACSQPEAGNPAAPRPATAATTAPPPYPPGATAPAVTSAEKPFEAYQGPDHDPGSWMSLCAAVTGTPADAKVVAAQTDAAYQAATDAFAKRDALAAVQARLDRATAEGKANPYVRMPLVLTRMPGYDVDHGRYVLAPLIGAGNASRFMEANV